MKKFKILLLVLISISIPFHSAFAAEQKTVDHYIPMDIDETYWAYEEIDQFINADILNGYMDEDMNMTVKPENKITRAQFVKILVNALGLQMEGDAKTFSDVKQGDWFYDYVNVASGLGIISGKEDGSFAPNAKITRDQMTKMIVLAFAKTVDFPTSFTQSFADINEKYWAADYINKAATLGIVKGYQTDFKPRNLATRAQAVVMIHRAIQLETSQMSSDEEITTFLKSHILKENSLIESNSVAELKALYQENGIGYYALEGEIADSLFPIEDEGIDELQITIDDDNVNLQVLSKSDRFATAEVTGIITTVVMSSQNPAYHFEMTINMDGEYYLKKDVATGKWKIYYYLPYFDEEEL